jgi:hypothetical protein
MAFYWYKFYLFMINITEIHILQKIVLLCNINLAHQLL